MCIRDRVNTTLCRTHGLKSRADTRPETERQGLAPRPSHDSRVASKEFVTHRVRYTGTARPNPIIGTPGVVTCASSLRCELHSRLQSPQVTTEDCPKTLLRDTRPSLTVLHLPTYIHTEESVERCLAIPNDSNTHSSFGAWSPVHARARRADRVARRERMARFTPRTTEREMRSAWWDIKESEYLGCLLYTSPSPRDLSTSRMPSSA